MDIEALAIRDTASSANDIYIGAGGDFATVTGLDAYGQIIRACVQTLRGELQLDEEGGIPYRETIFMRKNLVNDWKTAVCRRVSALPFVISVLSLVVSDITSNTLIYEMQVATDLGTASVTNA